MLLTLASKFFHNTEVPVSTFLMKAINVIFSKVSECSRSKNPFNFLNPCVIIKVPKYTESPTGLLLSCPSRVMRNLSNCRSGLSEHVACIVWNHSMGVCFCLQSKNHVHSLVFLFGRHCLKDVHLSGFVKVFEVPTYLFIKIENAKQNCKFVQCNQRKFFSNIYMEAYLYVI